MIAAFAHKYLLLKREDYSFINCKLSLILVLKSLFDINVLLSLALISLATFKSEAIILQDKSWDQILVPFYFFMTELLLIAIVSFVVLVNTVIQLCCSTSSSRNALSRFYKKAISEESKENLNISNPSALVRVSIWFLYVSICGLLSLFLLLKNATSLSQYQQSTPSPSSSTTTVSPNGIPGGSPTSITSTGNQSSTDQVDLSTFNILNDHGTLILLYFGGVIVLTLIFFTSLRYGLITYSLLNLIIDRGWLTS